jgi:general stress protein 26
MNQSSTRQHAVLWDLIKDIKFAMFTTRHGNGHLHSRPMTTQNKQIDEDELLWFFMSHEGDPVADLRADPTVNIVFADPGKDRYVSVSGTAQVVDDTARKQQLWSKLNEAWFPGGPTDPDLALVRVAIVHAHYWNVKDNKVMQLIKMAKAAVSGTPPKKLGEEGEVRVR